LSEALDPSLLMQLPFLSEAKALFSDNGITVRDLGDPAHDHLLQAGRRRLESDLFEGHPPSWPFEETRRDQALSFLVAALIAKVTSDRELCSKFALSEAQNAAQILRQHLYRSDGPYVLTRVLRSLGFQASTVCLCFGQATYDVAIDGLDLLNRIAPEQHPSWFPFVRGEAYLRAADAIQLARSAIARLILERLNKSDGPVVPAAVSRVALQVSSSCRLVNRKDPLSTYGRKPCVLKAMDRLVAGSNLSQFERFLVASSLLAAGAPVASVAELFKHSPDYDESITLYQVNHIAGSRGGRRYSPPSCNKVALHGLCVKGCPLLRGKEDGL
jgi:DNA primase large subunit